ncbi:hypothetical protein M758_6G100400, partial [Ceratodon purpureus]
LLHNICKYLGPIAYRSAGLLSVGEKIAEGGQAEIYEAHIKWGNKVFRKRCEEEGAVFVLKVFKSGVSLRHLQSKWPEGLLKYRAVIAEREKLHIPQPLQYGCDVQCVTVLRDGRFAFVMRREDEDLRSLIDRKRRFQWRHGPFRDEIAIGMMCKIARGMDWLHGCDIVHRDFKVSNVLVRKFGDDWMCIIADYECSIGVIGTGFWRAPEILQACKDGVVHQKPEIFSKAAHVYSYGMTCYEILTRKFPFKNHPLNDYDLILAQGRRPELPKYVDDWTQELLGRCWEKDPAARPSFQEIMDIISTNSAKVKNYHLQVQLAEEEDSKEEERIRRSLSLADPIVDQPK